MIHRGPGRTYRRFTLAATAAAVVVGVLAAPSATAAPAGSAAQAPSVLSAAELASVTAGLDRHAGTVGTAWSTDPSSGQVVLTVTSQAGGAKLAALLAAAGSYGSAVRVERVAGSLQKYITGGDAIYGGGFRCSLGFNVRRGDTYSFLTAGHCTNLAASWYANSGLTTLLGTRAGSSFPGNDYGIVRYDSSFTNYPGTVGSQDITSAANPTVGQAACRRGSTTGTRCGSVTGLNATVNYAEGTVTGMIRTNICAEPGDSGGPLYSGSVALGLTSGGSGNCQSGGTTFFQPVTEALKRYKVSVF